MHTNVIVWAPCKSAFCRLRAAAAAAAAAAAKEARRRKVGGRVYYICIVSSSPAHSISPFFIGSSLPAPRNPTHDMSACTHTHPKRSPLLPSPLLLRRLFRCSDEGGGGEREEKDVRGSGFIARCSCPPKEERL